MEGDVAAVRPQVADVHQQAVDNQAAALQRRALDQDLESSPAARGSERDRARDAPQAEVMAYTNSNKSRFRLTYRNGFYIM
jgi:hypothetical protein